LWVDYSGSRLFRTPDDIKYRFSTYLSYIRTAAEDVQNITKSIIHEIKSYPDKYDVPSIILALAQNGGVCNVQKEVGLRMVYASMTDSILQHVNSESIETKILIILRNLRETLCEKTAEKVIRQKSYDMNTHYLIPIRNGFAAAIGLNVIKDPDQWVTFDNYFGDFMKLYTVNEIVKILRIALNDSPRKLDYLDVLAFLEKHIPEDVDEYEFKQEFLFDLSNGHFSDAGIRFMLTKMEIIQPKTELDVEEPEPVTVKVPNPPSQLKVQEVEEERIPDWYEVGEFNLFDEIPSELFEPITDLVDEQILDPVEDEFYAIELFA